MSQPYIGEIRLMAFNFAPQNWAFCAGQIMSKEQNQMLFSLLGTQFGGNGITTFALPDLRGKIPIHAGGANTVGVVSGETTHVLSLDEMPAHSHPLRALAATADDANPTNTAFPAQGQSTASGNPGVNMYSTAPHSRTFRSTAISTSGADQPHDNQQPYLVLNYCIALIGIYPSPN